MKSSLSLYVLSKAFMLSAMHRFSYAFIAQGPMGSWSFAIAVGISGVVLGLLMRRRYVPLVITPPADGKDPNRGVLFYPKD